MEGDSNVLKRLARELNAWRSESSSIRPISVHIWSEAVEVARRAGVGPGSRTLRLDYSKLKSLTLKGPSRCSVPAPTFVELLPLPATLWEIALLKSSHRVAHACGFKFKMPRRRGWPK